MNREKLIRGGNNKNNNGNDETSFTREVLFLLDNALRSLAEVVAKKCIKEERFERYKDMKVTSVTPVYSDSEGTVVDYYMYDVTDSDTGDTHENIRSKNFDNMETDDGYAVDTLVRVYESNIVYIGFKL